MTYSTAQPSHQPQTAPVLAAPWALLVWLLVSASGAHAQASANSAPAPAEGAARAQAPTAAPKIYKYLSGEGTTSFSDKPPGREPYVVLTHSCYACGLTSTINWHSTRLHFDKFADEINHAARQFNVDPALVRAIIHAESGFNVQARSPKGALGLMQLMPKTARQLGVVNARAPHENIRGGSQYLAGLLVRFKNDVRLATAAYNAGPEAVQKYAGVPPYAETQVYVQRVRILHQRYRGVPQS